VAQDTALIVDHVAIAASDPLGLLDDAVEPSVRALEASSLRATKRAGHQVWMVSASRVVSDSWASITAS
jgi:hypothetical protein